MRQSKPVEPNLNDITLHTDDATSAIDIKNNPLDDAVVQNVTVFNRPRYDSTTSSDNSVKNPNYEIEVINHYIISSSDSDNGEKTLRL